MVSSYDKAELLAALWKLGAEDERLPTSHGILDKALKNILRQLPEQLADGLTFGLTGVGVRCFELPEILLAAQEAMLTSEPNPTYLSSIVTVERNQARQIVLSHGISSANAVNIGRELKDAVDGVRRSMEEAAASTAAA